MVTRYGHTRTRAPGDGVPLDRIETPRLVYAVIAVCTVAGAFLRFYQLARPGYLFGVTEFDDGVQFGDALRLVSGVIPYRDFIVVQPPGSFLVMAPAAVLAKVTGSAWGLAIARLLTAAADTACVALLGLLVRHRGPVAAGIACGIYAVYPDALIASQTFMLEPRLNLCCLLGALAVFDGDRLTRGRGRLIWGGVAFGLAVTVKIWAAVPLAVAGLLLLVRWPRRFGLLVAGVVAGLAVPVLPFLILAPGGLIHDVIVNQLTRAGVKHQPPLPRLSDLAGLSLFPRLSVHAAGIVVLAAGFVVALGYLAACRAGGRLPADLDWYALIGLVLVVGMLLFPDGYWTHYGAVAGPFIALVLALPAGLLRPAEHRAQIMPLLAISAVAAALIAGVGLRQLSVETQLRTATAYVATADRLIPSGSCVVSDYSSLLITADRFETVAGCPAMVDSYGTLLAMTDGRKYSDLPAVRALAAQWQRQLAMARYVWLEWGSQGRMPWTPALYAYFTMHFRLLGLIGGSGARNVPEPGLYGRRMAVQLPAARHRVA